MSETVERGDTFESTVDRAVRDLAQKARRAVKDHPEPEQLVDYQEGRLAAKEAEQVRRHLVACSECAQEVLDLEAFDSDEPEDFELRPSEAETSEDWATFQRSIEEQDAAQVLEMVGRTTPRPQGGPRARSAPATTAGSKIQSRLRSWLPLAASIVFALTGIGFWIAGVAEQGDSSTLSESTPNPYIFDLLPDGEGHRREVATRWEVEVPPGMDLLIPRLNLGDQTSYATYRADILDDAGTPVWSQAELRRQPAGQFTLLLKRVSLPAGEYQLRLVGLTGGEETLLATYSFQLRYTSAE